MNPLDPEGLDGIRLTPSSQPAYSATNIDGTAAVDLRIEESPLPGPEDGQHFEEDTPTDPQIPSPVVQIEASLPEIKMRLPAAQSVDNTPPNLFRTISLLMVLVVLAAGFLTWLLRGDSTEPPSQLASTPPPPSFPVTGPSALSDETEAQLLESITRNEGEETSVGERIEAALEEQTEEPDAAEAIAKAVEEERRAKAEAEAQETQKREQEAIEAAAEAAKREQAERKAAAEAAKREQAEREAAAKAKQEAEAARAAARERAQREAAKAAADRAAAERAQREAAKAAKAAERAAAASTADNTPTSSSQYGVPTPMSAIPQNLPAGETVASKASNETAYTFPGSFSHNNNAMKVTDRERLNTIVEQLSRSDSAIRIVGHTDSSGSATGNLRLGWLRAQSVKKLLIHLGVAESRIQVQSAGITQPIASNDSEEGRATNRRVVILLTN